ncbi:GH23828 [Drosophila grimshawi]|uniref:GH23828 n=2 Tax=Drosophila grimshawi TaxID=7222 RepID=B4JTE9_DROGR|nr:GH23828 [Drosophila grimshawi]
MATSHLPIQKSKYYEHDGEPGCQGLDEVNRMFRNFWDPTAYWVCDKQGTKARLNRCRQSQLYSEELGRCVHYAEWSWTEPKEPPSRPK